MYIVIKYQVCHCGKTSCHRDALFGYKSYKVWTKEIQDQLEQYKKDVEDTTSFYSFNIFEVSPEDNTIVKVPGYPPIKD